MEAYRLLTGFSKNPVVDRAAITAFDQAWGALCIRYSTVGDGPAREQARLALAHAIIAATKGGTVTDIETLRDAGLNASTFAAGAEL